jgi:sec-independent protein translocase protein TatA
MLNLPELILVAAIVFLVFGIGQLPKIGEAVGQMRRNYRKGLATDKAIDITPPVGAARPQDIEDAELADESPR